MEPIAEQLSPQASCVVENPKVIVGDLLSVVRNRVKDHGIRTAVYADEPPPGECEYVLYYVALKRWDLATYLYHAELRLMREGRRVDRKYTRSKGKTGARDGVRTSAAEEAPCLANVSTPSDRFSRATATFQDFPGVPIADAFQRLYRLLLKNGWTVLHADRDLGGISASVHPTVVTSNGNPFDFLNLSFEPLGGEGSRVSISVRSGSFSIKGTLRQGLCDILAAAAG